MRVLNHYLTECINKILNSFIALFIYIFCTYQERAEYGILHYHILFNRIVVFKHRLHFICVTHLLIRLKNNNFVLNNYLIHLETVATELYSTR